MKNPKTKRETQLDRIERKLDELLNRKQEPTIVINQTPKPWDGPAPTSPTPDYSPYRKAPWWMNPEVPPLEITCTHGNASGSSKLEAVQ